MKREHPSKLDVITRMYEALNEPIGVVVVTNNIELLRQLFYRFRKEDPNFEILALLQSPIEPSHVWIVRKDAKNNRDGAADEASDLSL